MSYLSVALTRMAERRHANQSEIARASGLSRGFLSRVFSGETGDLSDRNFVALLSAFSDPQAQAEIIAARCLDAKAGAAGTPGADLVEITVAGAEDKKPKQITHIELSDQTERAFAWLRSQCPLNPDLERHLVGYAKITGMK